LGGNPKICLKNYRRTEARNVGGTQIDTEVRRLVREELSIAEIFAARESRKGGGRGCMGQVNSNKLGNIAMTATDLRLSPNKN